MMKLSITDETIEMLPSRETLSWGSFHFGDNLASVVASNTSLALNAGSVFAIANSAAVQTITVNQH
jgi:hypothetical protein